MPTLALDFTASETLDPRITISGGANGTRVNSSGVIVAAASAPRFDYDPVTGEKLGLLIEEARTNLMLASHTGAGWTSNGGDTVTVNALLAPDGTTSATKIEVASGTTNLRNKSCTITANSTVSASIFVKAGSGGTFQSVIAYGASGSCVAWLNTATGAMTGLSTTGSYTAGSTKAFQYKNGWWRVVITVTTATDTTLTLETDQATASGNYTSAVGHFFYSWGGQVEKGAFATSLIPTTGATVTRTRDLPTMVAPNVAPWINSTQGTFVITADLPASGVLSPFIGFNASARSAGVYFDNKGYAGVIFTGDASTANTTTRPGKTKIAFGWSSVYAARVSMNGGTVAAGTNTSGVGATSIQLGHTVTVYTLNGHLKQVVYYPTLKSDFELKALSDPTAAVDMGVVNFDTINSTDIIPFIAKHGFDGATIKLERAYAPDWSQSITGTVIRFAGKVTSVHSIQGATANLSVSSWLVLLNTKAPRNLYQSGCLRTLYDAGCGLNPASFSAAGTVTLAGTGSFKCGLTTAGYYSQGRVVFTSGANNGISRTVKYNAADGTFTLVNPLPAQASIGDTFTAYAGCDLAKGTCSTKFNNLIKFKGTPFVPVPTTSLGSANTTTTSGGKG
jgi:uncharacterized phage protein (TIGR02218 family)